MDTFKQIVVTRRECVQTECETTVKLIQNILKNTCQVIEGLRISNDSNYIDQCLEYVHQSQIKVMESNLILQKFLKTPIPVSNDNNSMTIFADSINLEDNFLSSPPPCFEIHCLPTLQMPENLNSSCNVSVIETAKEEVEELNAPSSDFTNSVNDESVQVPSNSLIEDSIKPTYDFAQIPFTNERIDQTKPIESDLKNIEVEVEIAVPYKNVTEPKETKNYATILKQKSNENENKTSKTVGSNIFFPDFANKNISNKKQGLQNSWTPLKSFSKNSNKFSCKSPKKNVQKEQQIERSTKPNYSKSVSTPRQKTKLSNPQNRRQGIPKITTLKQSASANAEKLPDAQSTEKIPQTWIQLLENDSISQKLTSSQNEDNEKFEIEKHVKAEENAVTKLLDLQNNEEIRQTEEQDWENSNFETLGSTLESASMQTKLPDPQNYEQIQQTEKQDRVSANFETLGSTVETAPIKTEFLDPQNDEEIQQTEKQDRESANFETFKSNLEPAPLKVEFSNPQNDEEIQQTEKQDRENANFETLRNTVGSAPLEMEFSNPQNDEEIQQTEKQDWESANFETLRSTVESASLEMELPDPRNYEEIQQTEKQDWESTNFEIPTTLESASVKMELPDHQNYQDILETLKQDLESSKFETSKSVSSALELPSTTALSKSVSHSSSWLKKTSSQVPDVIPSFLDGEDDEYLGVQTAIQSNKSSLWEVCETSEISSRKRNHIIEELKTRNIMSIEQRHKQLIPRARMPDISIKPSSIKLSQKQKTILKTDSEEDIEEVLNENENYQMMEQNKVEDMKWVVPHAPIPNCNDSFMISSIENPGLFYIHLVNVTGGRLDELADRMELMYDNKHFETFSSKFEAKREMGNFFCLYVHGFWLRVEVINWHITASNTHVDVQFIDYGEYYQTDYRALRPLPPDLYSIPRIAQRCHLADLYPINTHKKCAGRQWERSSNAAFIQFCGPIQRADFEIITCRYCSIRKSYGIDFKHSNGESIAKVLIKNKLAICIKNKKTDFFENLGLTNAICARFGVDSFQIPTEQVWNAYWYHENAVKTSQRHTESYNSTDKRYNGGGRLIVTKPNQDQDLPYVGEERRIMITHVVDIETFYAHIDNGYSVHPGESLHNLHEFMNRYDIVKKYTSLTYTPIINQLVIAPHPSYFWSRAQVRQIGDPNESGEVFAELFYIDYGCLEWVPLSAVRNIVEILLQFPCLAIEFKMYNIEHKDGANYQTEKEFLEMYCNAELIVVVKAIPGHVVVQLQDEYNMDIGELLLTHGIGQWKKDHIFPSGDNHLLID